MIAIFVAGALLLYWIYIPRPPSEFRSIPFGISAEELETELIKQFHVVPKRTDGGMMVTTPQHAGVERFYFETVLPSKRFHGVRIESDSIGFTEALGIIEQQFGKPVFLNQNSDSSSSAWWVWNGDTSSAEFRIYLAGDATSHTVLYRDGKLGWD